MDVLYLKINDVLEYNPPYVQSGSDVFDYWSCTCYTSLPSQCNT